MSAVLDVATITEPGVYDIPADAYHADPVVGGSLSSTGARRLLPPSCPALYRYEQDNPGAAPANPAFDLGHAAHLMVLGAGPVLHVVDADSWRTADARAQRLAAYEAGEVPLLAADYERAQAMAAALREHEIGALFDPDRGSAEVTIVWRDDATGVMCRARLDWWLTSGSVLDYKTAHAVDLDSLSRATYQHGYYIQAAWYLAGLKALGLADDDTQFVFVAQLKDPPHLVQPYVLDDVAMRLGAAKSRQALQIYSHCTATGEWPAYHPDIALISLPAWAEKQEGAHLT